MLTIGNCTTPTPVTLVMSVSPLAAVHVAAPAPVGGVAASLTVNSDTSVNWPRWVAFPVASIRCSAPCTASDPCKVPLKGKREPPLASVSAEPATVLEGDVGTPEPSPAHAAAKTQQPSKTYRMGCPTFPKERKDDERRISVLWIADVLSDRIWS